LVVTIEATSTKGIVSILWATKWLVSQGKIRLKVPQKCGIFAMSFLISEVKVTKGVSKLKEVIQNVPKKYIGSEKQKHCKQLLSDEATHYVEIRNFPLCNFLEILEM